MKSRIVYKGYTEHKVTPSKYVYSSDPYSMGHSVTTGEPAYFKLNNDLEIKELVVEEYCVRDGFVEVPGEEVFSDTLIPIHHIVVIEPYDGPRTEPVEKGLRTFS